MQFEPLKNNRLLRALRCQPVDATPIWLMRQAGRYLPEYRATRSKAGSFLALAKTPELACEVTLQPLERFDLDAAILFSDILTIPDAMGLGLYFQDGEGPRFHHPVTNAAEIKKLHVPDCATELRYVTDAVTLIRRELGGRVPLIGFSGSPWTLACYMIEGGSSERFAKAKALLLEEPALAHHLLNINARAVTAYLSAQIQAGAQVVMIFDTWGGVLTAAQYREFSLRYLTLIAQSLPRQINGETVPLILFSKGVTQLEAIAATGCEAISLDWTQDLAAARQCLGPQVALQGNLDPTSLYANETAIKTAAINVLENFGQGPGHVFNLGHGITPDIAPEKVKVLVDTVHDYSRTMHQKNFQSKDALTATP
jgi:uroporphyrinogen decarboxylase